MVGEIRRRDIITLIEKIAEQRGPYAGNRAFGHIRKFFNVLVERDVIAASPCVGVKKPSVEQSRDRLINDAEVRALWAACDAIGGPACAAIKLLLLTGQRRGECATMTFGEIDGDVWRLPKEKTKNRQAHAVPLSRQALAVIEQQPRISGCDFVFTSGSKPIANWSRIKIEIDKLMPPETPPWRVHDLRRACASGLQRCGIRAEVIERALNHRSGLYRSVAGVYQVDPLTEEVRAALARWGDHVARVIKGEGGKIVKFKS
jgi:integrase